MLVKDVNIVDVVNRRRLGRRPEPAAASSQTQRDPRAAQNKELKAKRLNAQRDDKETKVNRKIMPTTKK